MGHLPVVEVLYDYEPVVDVRDKQNATPLHKACKRDQSHVAEFFIRKVRSRVWCVCVAFVARVVLKGGIFVLLYSREPTSTPR
jgi:ankyrin repeat protein